jgi:hypothetical protein
MTPAQRHIAAMRIVITTNCTLQEANAQVDADQARARWQVAQARLAAVQEAPTPTAKPHRMPAPAAQSQYWWERN